jgi:redox-sensitive bicupin YhaK (pirin superfamily)
MLHSSVEHGDSLGNKGTISAGDMQWMTAGSGIVHQEMPQGGNGLMWGLQLWVNLPSSHKMMKPRYREITSRDIPEHKSENGIKVKVISGQYNGIAGPVKDIICDPEYLDVQVPPQQKFEHKVVEGHTVFAYVLQGEDIFVPDDHKRITAEHLVLFGEGESLIIQAAEEPLWFLLISGKPIGEPVAWWGPIVMNSAEELSLAFKEYKEGTFIKEK